MYLKLCTIFCSLFFYTIGVSIAASAAEKAIDIQEVKTDIGITAWLVQSHSLPMVSIEAAFRAGAVFDPESKRGVANLTAALLTQGTGGLDAEAFQKKLDGLGVRMGAAASLLNISLSMDVLPEVIDQAFGLFATTVEAPTFREEDFNRLKDAALAGRRRIEESPKALAAEAFSELVYGRYHPYSAPVSGTEHSLGGITVKDVRAYHKKMFTRQNMVVSVVGDITPEELKTLLEKHFKGIPKGKERFMLQVMPTPQPPALRKKVLDIPQTTIIMGHKGLSRKDADYFPALFANHILGGGGFASLLMEEIREKRGLVYGVYSYFSPLPFWGSFQVVAQTKNKTAMEVIALVKKQIKTLQEKGVTQERYENALSYLVGSFPLRLDSNADILSYLTFMQVEDLGKDYMNTWVQNIRNVTRADIQRVFKERLNPEDMAVVMVGNPDGTIFKPTTVLKTETKPEVKAESPQEEKEEEKVGAQLEQPKAAEIAPQPVKTPIQNFNEAPLEEESVAAPITAPKTVAPPSAPKLKNDYRELKDVAPRPRRRRNVDAKNWL